MCAAMDVYSVWICVFHTRPMEPCVRLHSVCDPHVYLARVRINVSESLCPAGSFMSVIIVCIREQCEK